MSGNFIVNGVAVPAPAGLSVRNFVQDGVPRFLAHGTRPKITELVVHETVTRSVNDTIAVLKSSGLSVHLVMGPDGALTQHGDLATDLLWHASQHNGPSVGVEVVNPYYPSNLKSGMPWVRVIKAPWAHKGEYVVPAPAQAEAVAQLVTWTTSAPTPRIDVPRVWPGLRDGFFALGLVEAASKPLPGILAHQYFGHADGSLLVLYAWLRVEAGLLPDVAFEQAIQRATNVHRVDVRDLLSTHAVA